MTSAYLAWSNREIPIIVETPSSTEGVQTRMKIHYLSGMAADGKDFRFSSVNGSPLNYWIESIADNIYNVYIKLPANESTIYFYYGNNSIMKQFIMSIVINYMN
jgi:hypothetical protein